MKLVYKCEYCSQMGTKEEIEEHEKVCTENKDTTACNSCEHMRIRPKGEGENIIWVYQCKKGKDIPEGKMYITCDSYERKAKTDSLFDNVFGAFF